MPEDMDDRARLTRDLKDWETKLRRNPHSLEARFRRAKLLDALGNTERAMAGYRDVLEHDATHFGALNDLGLLLFKSGNTKEATACYETAVAHHPSNPIARANLGYMLLKGGKTAEARTQYEAAAQLAPDYAEARRGLALALSMLGEEAAAEEHRQAGFSGRFIEFPYRGEGTPIHVLLLVSVTSGNVHTDRFLDDRIYKTWKLVVEYYDPAVPLPPHDLVFNALGDPDACAAGLSRVLAIASQTRAPIINDPTAVLATGRLQNAQRLRPLEEVVAPTIALLPKAELTGPQSAALLERSGFNYPLLFRSPGFHTGQHFVKVDDQAALAAALEGLPGDELLAIEFLNARGADGNFRKYRVMIVDGKFYPLHLAISKDWKVHYFSADMANRPDHRAEDAAFLDDMPTALGRRAMQALERVRDTLGLDYGGIDFALDATGRVIIFEANATMIVHPPDADERWAYRRAPVDRILAAVRVMLADRAASAVQA